MSVMGSLVLPLLVSARALTSLSVGPFDENRKMCLELLLLLLLQLKLNLKAQTCAVNTARQKNIAEIVQLKLNFISYLILTVGSKLLDISWPPTRRIICGRKSHCGVKNEW